MKIGVFDSGVGGLSVANAIKKALPKHKVLLKEDKDNVPYGTKSPGEILRLVVPILQTLANEGCEVIVIACNTVSTNLMPELRQHFKIPLIAVEPMIKSASKLTKTGVIAVCATPTTLASSRYAWLKETYAKDKQILEPDCSDWVYMIEEKSINIKKIEGRIKGALDKKADVIVLGCTHYHWIEKEIAELSIDKAIILQPEEHIIKQLKLVIERLA